MERTRLFALAAGALGALLGLVQATSAGPNDPDATARTLVEQCANIKEGDLVLITGRPPDMAMLESICVEVRKHGAFPMMSVTTDRLSRRLLDEVPEKFDAQTDQFDLKMAGLLKAVISIDSVENEGLFADAPPARMAARAKAGMAAEEAFLKNGVKRVSLGNGLFPTKATAHMYGLERDKLAEIFWAGVNTDYSALQSTGTKVKEAVERGKTVHITNPNGTDLTFKVGGKECYVSDGVISKEDEAKGGAACQVWLPAGEVYGAPAPGTANGRVFFDRVFFQGKEILGVNMQFENGKMTSFTAKSGLEPAKALYDAAGTGKDEFGFFDIGINPSVKIPAGSQLQSWVPAGMVTVGIGGNTWAGGANDCPYAFSGFLPNSTFTVDDKPVVDKGTLKY